MAECELHHCEAVPFLRNLPDGCVDLVCTDPPYFGIVGDAWDNQWKDLAGFIRWFGELCRHWYGVLKPTGSLVYFTSIGRKNPLCMGEQIRATLDAGFTLRNVITWGKRRAYGKKDDYLYTREEILWFTKCDEWTFNVPLTNQLRGYGGFDPNKPAKSPYKRVTNVWTDIGEIFRPRRVCEKPVPLMERLVCTHSNKDDLVLDTFSGTGVTGVACKRRGRNFLGCDIDKDWIIQGQRDIDRASELVDLQFIETEETDNG